MNLRHSLVVVAIAAAAACFAPSAFAFQDTSPSTDQSAPPPRDDSHEEHQGVRQDLHEAGQEVKEGAHAVAQDVRSGAHHVHGALHRTAHWRRYHVCTRYWHHHCVRWRRR